MSKSAANCCERPLQPDEITAVILGVALRWTSIAEGLDAN
jgi:hypothetical protein